MLEHISWFTVWLYLHCTCALYCILTSEGHLHLTLLCEHCERLCLVVYMYMYIVSLSMVVLHVHDCSLPQIGAMWQYETCWNNASQWRRIHVHLVFMSHNPRLPFGKLIWDCTIFDTICILVLRYKCKPHIQVSSGLMHARFVVEYILGWKDGSVFNSYEATSPDVTAWNSQRGPSNDYWNHYDTRVPNWRCLRWEGTNRQYFHMSRIRAWLEQINNTCNVSEMMWRFLWHDKLATRLWHWAPSNSQETSYWKNAGAMNIPWYPEHPLAGLFFLDDAKSVRIVCRGRNVTRSMRKLLECYCHAHVCVWSIGIFSALATVCSWPEHLLIFKHCLGSSLVAAWKLNSSGRSKDKLIRKAYDVLNKEQG